MKRKVSKPSQLLDNVIRKACERVPQKRRKVVVFGFCFLFVIVFSLMLWDSFHNQEEQKIFEIKHIEPLDLPQDSLIQKFKNEFHGQKQ